MEVILNYLWELILQTLMAVGTSLQHNWKVLALSVLIAVGLKTYVDSEKLSKFLFRKKKVSILASVLFGSFTPLCACGTTAVIIGMLTTTLPWGPIMAFLTSSPLMSPDGFVFITGVIGLRFAVALTIASLVIGISSGLITNVIEKKTNFLVNQSRFQGKESKTGSSCCASTEAASCSCAIAENNQADDSICCPQVQQKEWHISDLFQKLKLKDFFQGLYSLGLKQILLFYVIFIAIGFMINYFIPTSIISILFGTKAFYAVPLASLIGLPLYLTTSSGTPIIHSLLESGASEGAMLAFMITGSATSAWVIAGLSTFMKRNAILLYVIYVLLGGIICGYAFDLVGLFF